MSLDDEKWSEPCPKYLVYIMGIEAMGAGNDRDLSKFNGAEAARGTPQEVADPLMLDVRSVRRV